MEADASRVVQASGGKVAGSVRHPTNTSDFSSFLLQAQASGADVIALANGGSDTSNSLKQAQEFGLTKTFKIAALAIFITDVHAVGPQAAQGLLLTTAFYWDRTPRVARLVAERSIERHGAMPTMSQAGVYSAAMHYLKAIDMAKAPMRQRPWSPRCVPCRSMTCSPPTALSARMAAWCTTCTSCR